MKTLHIMTSCNNNSAMYIMPQLLSIAENLSQYKIEFYLFHYRIPPNIIERIKTYADELKCITFNEIVIEDVEPYIELTKYGGPWPPEAYFSLCCHEYLSEDIDRVMYIDAGDIIINGDISEYYFDDFEGKSIIATLQNKKSDGSVYTKDDFGNPEYLRIITELGIINSGSYIINLNQLRADGISMADYLYLALALRENSPTGEKLYFGDQGFISVAFAGDIKYFGYPKIIDPEYMPYNFQIGILRSISKLSYTPVVLHFVGMRLKPFQAKISEATLLQCEPISEQLFKNELFDMNHKFHKYYEIYWEYCKKTPLYDLINPVVSAYGKALEDFYIPLCIKYLKECKGENKHVKKNKK